MQVENADWRLRDRERYDRDSDEESDQQPGTLQCKSESETIRPESSDCTMHLRSAAVDVRG